MKKIAGLYTILDSSTFDRCDPLILAKDYLQSGVSILQLRDKKRNQSPQSRQKFSDLAQSIAALKKDHSFTFIVNDSPDIAKEVGADGVHVGQDDPSIPMCRDILGRGKLIGYSSHSLEEALEAEQSGADYVAFGAIYPTTNKGPDHPIQGTEKLKTLVERIKIPVVAIGGINRSNINQVLSTGVSSVAMISALANAEDRVKEAKYFVDQFRR